MSLPGQDEIASPEGMRQDIEQFWERWSDELRRFSGSVLKVNEPGPASPHVVEALLATFDGRLTAAEKRMDRILAQLGVE